MTASDSSQRWRWPVFSLRTLLIGAAFLALVFAWRRDHASLTNQLQLANARIEIYTSRKAFEKRLRELRKVDFDDIDTTTKDVVAFQKDRYRQKGVVISSAGGQFAGRTFGFPRQYPAASGANTYSPGPIGKNPATTRTTVSFVAGGRTGRAAAFGVSFIDADFPSAGASSITVFGAGGRQLASQQGFSGPNAAPIFRGMIAVDDQGSPLPAITRVEIKSGSGWPGVDAGDGVVLDDFTFSPPVVD